MCNLVVLIPLQPSNLWLLKRWHYCTQWDPCGKKLFSPNDVFFISLGFLEVNPKNWAISYLFQVIPKHEMESKLFWWELPARHYVCCLYRIIALIFFIGTCKLFRYTPKTEPLRHHLKNSSNNNNNNNNHNHNHNLSPISYFKFKLKHLIEVASLEVPETSVSGKVVVLYVAHSFEVSLQSKAKFDGQSWTFQVLKHINPR